MNARIAADADGDARPLEEGFDIGYDEWRLVEHRLFLPPIRR